MNDGLADRAASGWSKKRILLDVAAVGTGFPVQRMSVAVVGAGSTAIDSGYWKAYGGAWAANSRVGGIGKGNGETFRAYVEQILAPTLIVGDIVVMDNLSSHKVAGAREAIEARGAGLLWLPPYSPDLNPIEKSFSKLRSLIRKEAARTRETLWSAIGTSFTDSSQTNA